MAKTLELTDDGYVSVKIGDASSDLDLYQVHNRLVEIQDSHRAKPPHEKHAAIAALLQTLGYGECSHRLAVRFAEEIFDLVAELDEQVKKNSLADSTPALPASTAPPSSS